MSRLLALALASVLVGLACAQTPVPRNRFEREETARQEALATLDLEAWHRVELPGFSVYSPLPEAEVTRVARRVADFAHVANRFVFGAPRSNEQRTVDITVFATREQYGHYQSSSAAAAHFVGGDAVGSIVLGPSVLGAIGRAVMQHELVHAVIYRNLGPGVPLWFHEGMAEFLSTMFIQGDLATVGSLPQIRMEGLRATEAPKLARLLSVEGGFGPLGYAYAWTFIHYGLFAEASGSPNRARAFQRFVAANSRGGSWMEAYESAFDVPFSQIEREWQHHCAWLETASLVPKLPVEIRAEPPALEFEALSRGEVMRHLARLAARHAGPTDLLAQALLDALLAEDPDDIEWLAHALIRHLSRKDLAQASATAARLEPLPTAQRPEVEALRLTASARLLLARFEAADEEQRDASGTAWMQQASRLLLDAARLSPSWAEPWQRLAHASASDPTSDAAIGIDAFSRVVSLRGSLDRVDRLALARLRLRAGRREEARAALRDVIDNARNTPEAREARALMDEHELW